MNRVVNKVALLAKPRYLSNGILFIILNPLSPERVELRRAVSE